MATLARPLPRARPARVCRMAAPGPKLRFARREGMSAFEGKADITLPRRRFGS